MIERLRSYITNPVVDFVENLLFMFTCAVAVFKIPLAPTLIILILTYLTFSLAVKTLLLFFPKK